ncbi:hypothetical protein ABZ942_13300 [Nocardia sp. NPDC046473]|uniref:hypothetical protein n=1 Tax=Nocardia sp. NPDC046473 TaxID=3155733 RepID=UPI0033ECB2EE
MTPLPPRRSSRRPRVPRRSSASPPSTLWTAGTVGFERTGFGPIPVLSRAVQEFSSPRGLVLLAALSPRQQASAPEVMQLLDTGLDRRRRPPRAATLAAIGSGDDLAELIIASLLPPMPALPGPELLTSLTLTAADALHAGGILVVLTRHAHDRHGRLLDPTGAVVTAAQAADLVYLSHIVAAPVTGAVPAAPASTAPHHSAHYNAHLDLLVFLRPGYEDAFESHAGLEGKAA